MPPNPTPAPIPDVIERLERAEGACVSPGERLNALAKHYRADGDYLRCRRCTRPQQVMWCHADFVHTADCRNEVEAPKRPWLIVAAATDAALRAILAAGDGGRS